MSSQFDVKLLQEEVLDFLIHLKYSFLMLLYALYFFKMFSCSASGLEVTFFQYFSEILTFLLRLWSSVVHQLGGLVLIVCSFSGLILSRA